MEYISKALFFIANALLVPDIILLIVFFVRAMIMVGATYNTLVVRRRTQKRLRQAITDLTPEGIPALRTLLPKRSDSLFTIYLADLLERGANADYADYMLTNFEVATQKDVNQCRLLTKLGPIMGLLGTLISMSPALVGLSTGDISGMAYNMQVVFATTVVGLLISAVGLTAQQLKQRWYADELNCLDYVARIMQQQ